MRIEHTLLHTSDLHAVMALLGHMVNEDKIIIYQ